MGEAGFAIGMIALFGLLIAGVLSVMGWAVIWALNLLFHLNIEFNFWTCTAIVILLIIIGSFISVRSQKS